MIATIAAMGNPQDHLREIVAMMPLALFIKDAQSRIVLMNPACEAMWGVPFALLADGADNSHFPPDQQAGFLAQDRATFAARRQTVNEEVVWNASLGEDRHLQTYKRPIFDEAGAPLMLIAMCIDITERKRAELALERTLQQLRALSDHQHTAKEQEGRRIALDIHDELAQNLLALKLDASMLHARTGARQPLLHERAGQALDTLDTCIRSLRNVINQLHPSTLELGLSVAIEWLVRQTEQRHGLRCRLQLIDDSANPLLDQRQTSGIFRIVQSALDHLCRLAGASELQVYLNLRPDHLAITLHGDGHEAAELATPENTLGVKGIKERVAAFGGELVIARSTDAGTILFISLPGAAQQTDCVR